MPPSRLGTVYDFSGLRIHTDGSLVNQTSKNAQIRYSRRTVRDPHGSWIAKDAGGLASVPRFRKVVASDDDEEGNDEGDEDDDDDHEEDRLNESSPSGSAEKPAFKTSRARKRHKFATDTDYLAPTSFSKDLDNNPESDPRSFEPLAPPSSDLLKYIHYRASTYYHERGLLLNASKQYRKERKKRKLARLAQNGASSKRRVQSEKLSGSEEEEEEEEEGERNELDEDEVDVSKAKDRANVTQKRKARRKEQDLADMYKTMDGSALMAIGMLLQEHVAELLESR